jgi:hypothetical protein
MEAELQAQIPGIDRVISEYSVVRWSLGKPPKLPALIKIQTDTGYR